QSASHDGAQVGGGGIVRPAQRAADIEQRQAASARQQRAAKLRIRLKTAPRVRGFPGSLGRLRASLVVRRPAHAAAAAIRYGKWPSLSPSRGSPGLAQVGGSSKNRIPGAQSLTPLTSLVPQPPSRVE